LWHIKKFSLYIEYIILEFMPLFSFIPLLLIPGIVSTDLIFPFIYRLYTVFVLYSPSSLLQLAPAHPNKTYSTLLLSEFVKEKNDTFVWTKTVFLNIKYRHDQLKATRTMH
jgi:hypothetical protein